jgi:TolB-like protein
MKKTISFFTILAVMGILFSCASGGKKSTIANLDTAIQQASKEINDTLPAGTKVALLNFNSESDVFSDYVIEEMSIALVKGKKLIVVDRKEIELIRKEMNFQMSGEVSDESAQKIGIMLGAQSIVSGSLVNMGETYRFRTKAINVNSAAIETSSSISVGNDPQIKHLLSQGKKTSTPQATVTQGGTKVVPTQNQPNTPETLSTSTPQAYKIGDTGPAGGIIFYDKGNNSGGWRYLEAAPMGAEFQAVWSVRDIRVDNTKASIGYGKQNTKYIVETFKQTAGEWDSAPLKINDLVLNGFNDWFLPSRDELDQMYGTLKRKDIGDFRNEIYWSSTESREGWDYQQGVYVQNFKDGTISLVSPYGGGKANNRYCVRPIRQVTGSAGTARSSLDVNGGTTDKSSLDKGNIGFGTILGILVLGGIFAYMRWGPSPARVY